MVKGRRVQARRALVVLGVLWTIGLAAGLSIMWRYDMTPGKGGEAPALWPVQSRLLHHPVLPSLVMLLHPQCSCSQASVEELSRLLAHFQGHVSTTVLFYLPAETAQPWQTTALWRTVKALPGVQAVHDLDGREAKLFQAYTSGYTVLYDASGALLFHGGITPARGHVGDNAGSAAIAAVLDQQQPTVQRTAVFGCDVFDSEPF